jgi:myo-inositol-1(or 4)-monophosphatase
MIRAMSKPAAALPSVTTRRALRRLALAACDVGAARLRRALARRTRPRAERKGVGDFVTMLDRELERTLRGQLLAARPSDGFVGEEEGMIRPDAPFVWVVDPIDGTSNFAAGFDHFAVSVACLHRGRPIAAAAATWPGDERFHAALGLGAAVGRRRLRLDTTPRAVDARILGVQWFRDRRGSAWTFLQQLADSGARIRVHGSSVTQICDVARGRLDGNVQEQGKLWDIAAAALIATEAGARFTDWRGRDPFPLRIPVAEAASDVHHFPSVVAAPTAHRALIRLLPDAPDAGPTA